MSKRIAIIGGGPIGLETALYARALGHLSTVYEKGSAGENVRRWGFVEMFSSWKLNVSPLGLEALEASAGAPPDADSFPSGLEFSERYLTPIARSLAGSIEERCEVAAVGREGLLKGEEIASAERRRRPFRLLLRRAGGIEESVACDCVIDASGVYGTPLSLGAGGIPAVGEHAARERIDYRLPDILGADRERFEGRRTLLVGSGYSAATALRWLLELSGPRGGDAGRAGEVLWLWRRPTACPLPVFAEDPLPERDRLGRLANAVAASPPPRCVTLPGRVVERIDPEGERTRVMVRETESGNTQDLTVDRVLALVGFRPDLDLFRELQVHTCYASEGPMKLAASLLTAGGSSDCLTSGGFGAASLVSPEPGFFIVGHKSYGRRSDFLLRTGREQIRDVFRLIEERSELDLYGTGAVTP